MNNTGMLIKQKRKQKKMTLEEVSKHVGLSKSTLSKIENNKIENLKRSTLISLSNLLDLNPLQLIDNIEIDQEITVNGFKTQVNYLLHQTKDLSENEKKLIRDYINLILSNKGE